MIISSPHDLSIRSESYSFRIGTMKSSTASARTVDRISLTLELTELTYFTYPVYPS
jgi:hypothetical protein